jgi:hypothetical protein
MYFLDPRDRFRIERSAQHLYSLGARSVAEFLAEGVGEGDDLTRLINRLQRYQHLTSAVIRTAGGDRFSPRLREGAGMSRRRIAGDRAMSDPGELSLSNRGRIWPEQ